MKTIEQAVEVGIIVGRFQVPELHEAHNQVIQHVVDNHPRVILFLGLSPCKCTYNNPLDFQTRKSMIEDTFDVEIYYIEDMAEDEMWSKELDKQIARHLGPNQKCVLYGSRDSFISHYFGKYPTIELSSERVVSGREIRKNVGNRSKDDPAFRAGVIWAVENQWQSVLPTIDVAIHDKTNNRVLLAKKSGQSGVRFVGGFASVNSNSYEDDAKREVLEETGLECQNFRYIGSTKINDWRYRGEANKIKTILFVADYIFGAPKADDDIAEVVWVSMKNLDESMFVPEHKVLCQMFNTHINNL